MNLIAQIKKELSSMEKCVRYFKGNREALYPALERSARRINAIVEDKLPDRRSPNSHPSREENKNRYKKEDIRQEDKPDYKDTLFDPDLRKD